MNHIQQLARALLVAIAFVTNPLIAQAHLVPDGSSGEGGSKFFDAFTHWPPSAHDAHYYLEAVFFITFIVLLVIQLVQKQRAKQIAQ